MLEDNQKKRLETLAVELALALRSAYLSEQGGRPPMNYWEQMENRMRAAARQTASASEWASLMQRRLQIGNLPKGASSALIDLVRFCDEHQAHTEFLDLVERDHGLLVALTRQIVEERKESANANV